MGGPWCIWVTPQRPPSNAHPPCRRGRGGGGSGSPAGGSPGAGAGVFGEGSVRCADDAGAERAPADRWDAAAPVRLDAAGAVPSEATFSRAFAAFAATGLPERGWWRRPCGLVWSATSAGMRRRSRRGRRRRRKPPKPPKRRRGRPRKGEQRPPRRCLERQQAMTLADLPRACDVGTKRNAKGYKKTWVGYKLHLDAADGGVPVSCILTSASLHVSQVALPLAHLTAGRVTRACTT